MITAKKTIPIDDDIAKRVDKVETLAKQRDKNRIQEYLILVSAEMENNTETKPY